MTTMNQRVAHAFQKAIEMNDSYLTADQNKAIRTLSEDWEFLEAVQNYLNIIHPPKPLSAL